ncbi:hypothetical protein RGC52_07985, partial [Helicobacter pylori]|uniref:hypothetical protein n=1 Tax=Helicobacter pylori TaxID=210 RepID=UPI002928A69B
AALGDIDVDERGDIALRIDLEMEGRDSEIAVVEMGIAIPPFPLAALERLFQTQPVFPRRTDNRIKTQAGEAFLVAEQATFSDGHLGFLS